MTNEKQASESEKELARFAIDEVSNSARHICSGLCSLGESSLLPSLRFLYDSDRTSYESALQKVNDAGFSDYFISSLIQRIENPTTLFPKNFAGDYPLLNDVLRDKDKLGRLLDTYCQYNSPDNTLKNIAEDSEEIIKRISTPQGLEVWIDKGPCHYSLRQCIIGDDSEKIYRVKSKFIADLLTGESDPYNYKKVLSDPSAEITRHTHYFFGNNSTTRTLI